MPVGLLVSIYLGLFCFGSFYSSTLAMCQQLPDPRTKFYRVNCNDRGLTFVPKYPELPRGTMSLNLRRNDIIRLEDDSFKYFLGITEIFFDYNRIEHISNKAFRGPKRIRTLSLIGNELTTIPSDTFYDLLNLEILHLRQNPITTIDALAFKDLNRLVELDLSKCHLHTIDARAFSGLPLLQKLDLSHNSLTTLEMKILPSDSQLTKLNLQQNTLNCDCRMKSLKKVLLALETLQAPGNVVKCHNPDTFRGESLTEIVDSDLACAPELINTTEVSYVPLDANDTSFSLLFSACSTPVSQVKWYLGTNEITNSSVFNMTTNVVENCIHSTLNASLITLPHSPIKCVASNQAGEVTAKWFLSRKNDVVAVPIDATNIPYGGSMASLAISPEDEDGDADESKRPDDSSRLDKQALIAGVVCGTVVLVLVLIVAILLILKRRKRSKDNNFSPRSSKTDSTRKKLSRGELEAMFDDPSVSVTPRAKGRLFDIFSGEVAAEDTPLGSPPSSEKLPMLQPGDSGEGTSTPGWDSGDLDQSRDDDGSSRDQLDSDVRLDEKSASPKQFTNPIYEPVSAFPAELTTRRSSGNISAVSGDSRYSCPPPKPPRLFRGLSTPNNGSQTLPRFTGTPKHGWGSSPGKDGGAGTPDETPITTPDCDYGYESATLSDLGKLSFSTFKPSVI